MVGALALAAAGCGGGDDKSSDGGGGGGGSAVGDVTALPASSCAKLESKATPDLLLVSDLPMQGSSRTQTVQMVQAIKYVLDQRDWKAGDYNIGFQACDDATAQAAKWDSGKCNQNAQAYAANKSVIGVIGTFNSGCAAIEIPVLNQAPGGAVAMVSPANTFPCLTVSSGCDKSEPDKYYPTGKRNYTRVVPYDAFQAAIQAQFMKEQGIKKLYVLNDKEAYGLAVATLTKNAAEHVGIEVVGFSAWAKESASYEATMRKIGSTGADAVFLGGLIDENGAQVIKDKVSVLGPNDGKVKLFAPDGFTAQATIDEAGAASKGMYMSVAGTAVDNLVGPGKEFVESFTKQLNGKPVDPYSTYAAQAAVVMLDAIAKSDGSRQSVVDALFQTKIRDGILGSFDINKNGDVAGGKGAVVKYVMYIAADKLVPVKELEPDQKIADAALGGGTSG
ncbi:MAG: branched-chain amino acid ABC transporter substrate-binding protein [Actinomycetota bacterium]|nr:branched-chain amino acid ABC transporter substrate-binding protein [Actinomycetota bacterium]